MSLSQQKMNGRYWLMFTGKLVFIFLLLVFLFTTLKILTLPQTSAPHKSEYMIVRIPEGATLSQVADSLMKQGLLRQRDIFLALGKLTGMDKRIHAGMFRVPTQMSSWELLKYLASASPALIKVTFPEGILAREMAGILTRKVDIDSARFMQLVYDSSFARKLGVELPSLEGFLLPETYYFPWRAPEEKIIETMVHNTLAIFQADSVQEQLRRLNMSKEEIVILASIIEGEVMVDSERVLVSSVYHNRLRRNWRLQADPTIQFLVDGPPRRLTLRDLKIDSPYNTYLYPGLPPGPINNPGKKSILAAIFPARTTYLYFVATGDGGHHFSRTNQEHAYWKRKLDKLRRTIRQKRMNK